MLLRRWLVVAALLLVALLYYRPLRTYFETRGTLQARRAEVRALRAQQVSLERKVAAASSPAVLAREARRLGYVRPGEHLYIVKGIEAWREHKATLRRHGR